MDIRNWPLDRIMQLPDHCFGRRWLVACGHTTGELVDVYSIVAGGVPDRCVVWEVVVTGDSAITMSGVFELAWGDALPTTGAEWSALQKMFPGQGEQDGADWNFHASQTAKLTLRKIKQPSPAAGLRPVLRSDGNSTGGKRIMAFFVISSIPTEVPDCLLSV